MRRATILALALTAVVTPLRSGPAEAKEPHEIKLKHPICEDTYIVGINSRLFGSAVNYANGKYGVSYDYVPELSERAQAGDKVRLCLVAEYVNCPKGDDRGKTYRATDLRTRGTWTLMDSEHICGGA